MVHYTVITYYRHRTDAALQKKQDNKRKEEAGLQSRQTEAWRKAKWKEESRDEERVGGTALTPACLLYLGAQHGYGCCVALLQRHDCIPLLTHTAPLTYTHRLAASPCCLAPSLWASLAPPPTAHFDTHTHHGFHPSLLLCCSYIAIPALSLSLIYVCLLSPALFHCL